METTMTTRCESCNGSAEVKELSGLFMTTCPKCGEFRTSVYRPTDVVTRSAGAKDASPEDSRVVELAADVFAMDRGHPVLEKARREGLTVERATETFCYQAEKLWDDVERGVRLRQLWGDRKDEFLAYTRALSKGLIVNS